MAKRRPSGDGMVRKRDDGRWEGRIVVGHKKNGDPIFHHDYANTQKDSAWLLAQALSLYHDNPCTLCTSGHSCFGIEAIPSEKAPSLPCP